jgi:nucleotide-binding universal stress UspA family protein
MPKKILCAVDFSPGSDRAVQKAEELAKALSAEVELFHAYQVPVLALPDAPVTVSPNFVADLTDRAEKLLRSASEPLQRDGVPVSTKLVEGVPAEAIAGRAREIGAEMIVLGTHGRSGFRRFLLGSTAERVVRISVVPVLTVHIPE